jgi:pre-60S factor REI1
VIFEDTDALKQHYRTDWHKYNLKRDTNGLPVVGKELFDRVVMQAEASKSASQKVVSNAHLKRKDKVPRSVARARRLQEWCEHHQEEIDEAERKIAAGEDLFSDDEDGKDGEDSDWESVDEAEAEAVLARIETMNIKDNDDEDDSESDDDGYYSQSGACATVTLADNGFELIIHTPDGRTKRIGPRELKRYYKQRHKPKDTREEDEIANREVYERMAKVVPEKKLGTVKGERGNGLAKQWVKINQLQRKAERGQQKYMAKSHNIFAGSGNKKFDMNMQNAKTKLPKSVPY